MKMPAIEFVGDMEAAIGIEPMNKGFAAWRSSLRKIASVFTSAFSLSVSPILV
jgi:hypothetical protein